MIRIHYDNKVYEIEKNPLLANWLSIDCGCKATAHLRDIERPKVRDFLNSLVPTGLTSQSVTNTIYFSA